MVLGDGGKSNQMRQLEHLEDEWKHGRDSLGGKLIERRMVTVRPRHAIAFHVWAAELKVYQRGPDLRSEEHDSHASLSSLADA